MMPPTHRRLSLRASTLLVSAALVVSSAACSSESGSVEAFCEAVVDVPPLATVVSGFAETYPAEVSSRLSDAESAYADLRDSAPGDIDDEVDRVVDLAEEVMDAVREHSEDRDAATDRIRSSMADHPDAEEASAAVVAYAAEHCDVDLDPTPDEDETVIGDEAGGGDEGAATRPEGPPGGR